MSIIHKYNKNYSKTGTQSFISFNRLMPQLKELVALKDDEEINGIKIDNYGIHVSLSFKKRKLLEPKELDSNLLNKIIK